MLSGSASATLAFGKRSWRNSQTGSVRRIVGHLPDEGACRRCRRTATAAYVVWECERHARLRKTKLEELPDGIRPAKYVHWILPTSHDKAIVSQLWTKLAEFVYDDDGPDGRLCSSRKRWDQHPPRPP
ncbi:hypothetical protein HPB47_019888 [Ixodes persulcatus]|uniref:Uncharacterized protein n=1 Tax=Ixodes persulcatus TaxID=34615 RepID=A0AC60QIW8_IXOPE|nr:hypothetical protein HPB47_019888 [Ixodes persulcatus]